jgi:NADH-quinone oxidoreductase subunit D
VAYTSMEDLISHFLNWQTGIKIQKNIAISLIESPKGEFGVTLLANNTTKPQRCKVKSPSYYNLQFLPFLTKGHYLADLATIIGTIDIVFGEVDR